jgi:hypothetical protein
MPAASLTLQDVLPFAAIGLGIAVAVAGYSATRKDERYKVASGERDEYRARAERLQEDLVAARSELAALTRLPPVERVTRQLDALIDGVDDLRQSLAVHADPELDRRAQQVPGTPRRRITDGS